MYTRISEKWLNPLSVVCTIFQTIRLCLIIPHVSQWFGPSDFLAMTITSHLLLPVSKIYKFVQGHHNTILLLSYVHRTGLN